MESPRIETPRINTETEISNRENVIKILPSLELDKTLENLALETPVLTDYIHSQCSKTPTSKCCSRFTRISLYTGWILGSVALVGASTISLINLSDKVTASTGTIVTALVGGALNFVAGTCSALSTGCFPNDESRYANKKQNSEHELNDHFKQLYFRMINLYFKDDTEKSKVIELAKKINKNSDKIKSQVCGKIGNKLGEKIVSDFLWVSSALQNYQLDEKILEDCPNQDLLFRFNTFTLLKK